MSGQSKSSSTRSTPARIPAHQIQAELARLLGSDQFRATERGRRMLCFLVEEVLAGRSNQIKGRTIAVEVLGRGEEFSASKDPIVSIEVRKVREALEHYYLTAGRSNPVEIGLPRRTYVPSFSLRDNDLTLDGKIRDRASRWVPVIEVQPIRVGSSGSLGGGIGSCLTEEIAAELCRFRELAVVVSNPETLSSGIPAQGRLCGAVRINGTRGVLTLRLEIATSGTSVWADRFEFSVGGVEESTISEEEVARTVATRIGGDHGAVNRDLIPAVWGVKTCDRPLGYEAMMAYYHFDRQRSIGSLKEASKLLERACAADPSRGLLKAMLANTRIFHFSVGISDDPHLLHDALDLAYAAVRLDPEDQMCLETIGLILFHKGQPEAALESLERAYQANPNSTYRVALIAWDMMLCGKWERGRELLVSAMSRNPGNPSWLWFAICWDHFRNGRFIEALGELDRPDLPVLFWLPLMRAAILAKLGRLDEANNHVRQLLRLEPSFAVRGKSLIARFIKEKKLFNDLVDGLVKAGVTLEGGP